jgi:hypothetical protein
MDQNCAYAYVPDKATPGGKKITLDEMTDSVHQPVDVDDFNLYADFDESLQSVRERDLQNKLSEARELITKLQSERAGVDKKVCSSSVSVALVSVF